MDHSRNLVNPLGDLSDGVGLAVHSLHHNGHFAAYPSGALAGALQGLGDFGHYVASFIHRGNGTFNELFGRFGGLVRLVCQIAHLVSHNGEAFTGCARPSSLHSGIQGQNIGLERYVFDGGNNFTDFFRRMGNFSHRGVELFNILHANPQISAGFVNELTGFPGTLGSSCSVSSDFGGGSGQLFDGTGLFRGALG